MSYTIINDLHLGLTRRTGATPDSMEAYQKAQLSVLEQAVSDAEATGSDIIILGDLFDKPIVPYETLWRVCNILQGFEGQIIAVAGNHDEGGNKTVLTAFGLLCKLCHNVAEVQDGLFFLPNNEAVIVSHQANQKLLDSVLEDMAILGVKTLLAHCNYDNPFTEGKDHSLNLTPEQASKFTHVILGHEHQKRDLPGIDILGAPLPCAISEASRSKGYHRWEGPGHDVEFIESWNTETGYAEIDWHNLHATGTTCDFIRVVGTAEPEEAATVIQEVARFRENCNAFFISNSVHIGEINMGEIEEAAEADLHTFNPRAELLLALPEQYQEKMRRFLS